MSEIAKGEFVVVMEPLTFDVVLDKSGLGRMSIDKRLSGDLVGTARGQMLSARTGTAGSAGYVAIERITGQLKGMHGEFVLQHAGTMTRGVPALSVIVVPDSGTGELTGIAGEFRIAIEGGKHSYEFHYSLPELATRA